MTREEAIKKLKELRYIVSYSSRTALEIAIEALQERPLQPPFKLKTLADSTLMSMTKAELVEYVRMCEKNAENAYAQIDQQAKNVKKLLDEQERPKGRWIEHNNDDAESPNDFLEGYDCSECGGYKFIKSNFCPNCGADMRESEQE